MRAIDNPQEIPQSAERVVDGDADMLVGSRYVENLARLDRECELMIVGDGERREELREMVVERGIDDRVSFEGYIPREEIPHQLSGAKVSLEPLKIMYQLDYTRLTKILESMAVGTPYAASAVREIDLVSEREKTEVACENDPRSIHDTLERLLGGDYLGRKIRINGTSFISKHHNWQNIGSRTSNTMERVIS